MFTGIFRFGMYVRVAGLEYRQGRRVQYGPLLPGQYLGPVQIEIRSSRHPSQAPPSVRKRRPRRPPQPQTRSPLRATPLPLVVTASASRSSAALRQPAALLRSCRLPTCHRRTAQASGNSSRTAPRRRSALRRSALQACSSSVLGGLARCSPAGWPAGRCSAPLHICWALLSLLWPLGAPLLRCSLHRIWPKKVYL